MPGEGTPAGTIRSSSGRDDGNCWSCGLSSTNARAVLSGGRGSQSGQMLEETVAVARRVHRFSGHATIRQAARAAGKKMRRPVDPNTGASSVAVGVRACVCQCSATVDRRLVRPDSIAAAVPTPEEEAPSWRNVLGKKNAKRGTKIYIKEKGRRRRGAPCWHSLPHSAIARWPTANRAPRRSMRLA